jgi:hypothetical protein
MHIPIIIRKEQHKHGFHQHHKEKQTSATSVIVTDSLILFKNQTAFHCNDGGDDHDEDVELNYSLLLPLFVQQKNT